MKTPNRNQDIKNLVTGLSDFERHEALNESAKLKEARLIEQQKAYLGSRYLLDLRNAPARGTYHPSTGARLA